MKTVKYYLQVSIAAFVAAIACPSCNDTWDDHYDVHGDLASGMAGSSLWENLNKDAELSPFNRVLQACGYDIMLDASQIYTVWAPVITDAEADDWIRRYEEDKALGRLKSENTAIKQFIMNHLAYYNHQISTQTDDTVLMRNGKYLALTPTTIGDGVAISDVRMPSNNGMLYKVGERIPYFHNVWEAIQADSVGEHALDSVARYFEQFEELYFDASSSVPDTLDADGNLHYIDSVTVRYNSYFNSYGNIDSEDSVYYYLAPTNKVWKEKIEEYKKYFVCAHNATTAEKLPQYRDSIQNLYAKQCLLGVTFFNARRQPDRTMRDSIVSTVWSGSSYADYNGEYKYDRPFDADGIFGGLSYTECSNGRLYKTDDWKITPEETFMQKIKIEAESSRYYTVKDETKMIVSVESQNNEEFRGKVSGDQYLLVTFSGNDRRPNPEITFDISGTYSNCPYDIKVVFATRLARDANQTDLTPRNITASINYYDTVDKDGFLATPKTLTLERTVTDAEVMDTMVVARDFIFPVCNVGETVSRVQLTIASNVSRTEVTNGTYSNNLAIDCIIFEPHVTPVADEDDENN